MSVPSVNSVLSSPQGGKKIRVGILSYSGLLMKS